MGLSDPSLLRFLPATLAGLSWLGLIIAVAMWWVPGFDPATPGFAERLCVAAGGASMVLSLSAVALGLAFLAKGVHRGLALLGVLVGLPLATLYVVGLIVSCMGG